MIPYRLSAIKLRQMLRACVYEGLLCAFFEVVAAARAQVTVSQVFAALDVSTDDCALITGGEATPPADLVLPSQNTAPTVTDVPWFISPVATVGGTSLRSPDIDNNQRSCLVLDLSLPANSVISLASRTSSAGGGGSTADFC